MPFCCLLFTRWSVIFFLVNFKEADIIDKAALLSTPLENSNKYRQGILKMIKIIIHQIPKICASVFFIFHVNTCQYITFADLCIRECFMAASIRYQLDSSLIIQQGAK